MSRLVVVWLLFGILSASCASSRRFAQSPGASLSQNPSRIEYPVSCEDEEKGATPHLNYPASLYYFFVQPNCSPRSQGPQKVTVTQTAQIIFVIDVTDSMKEVLQTIRLNLVQLSQALSANGWDVRYAAIGFADDFNSFRIATFGTADALLAQMSAWSTSTQGVSQKAGQLALEQALKMLEDYQSQEPKRASADPIIIYMSDGQMFAGNDPKNYSTDLLAKRFKDDLARFPKLRLYYSLPKGTNTEGPLLQMRNFVEASGIQSSPLEFPISSSAISLFTSEFSIKTASPFGQCQLQNLRYTVKATGSTLPLQGSIENIFDHASKSQVFHFIGFTAPKERLYTLFIDRCCTDSDKPTTTCTHPETRPIQFSFPSSL